MRKAIAAIALTVASAGAHAEFVGGAGYAHLSDSGIGLESLYATGGYKIDMAEGFSIIPEARVGIGVGDSDYNGATVSLDSLYGINVRAQWDGQQAYAFVAPSYTHAKLSASYLGNSLSSGDWEFGGGVGAGYKFSDTTAAEVIYEDFNGTSVFSLGIRYNFPAQ